MKSRYKGGLRELIVEGGKEMQREGIAIGGSGKLWEDQNLLKSSIHNFGEGYPDLDMKGTI